MLDLKTLHYTPDANAGAPRGGEASEGGRPSAICRKVIEPRLAGKISKGGVQRLFVFLKLRRPIGPTDYPEILCMTMLPTFPLESYQL